MPNFVISKIVKQRKNRKWDFWIYFKNDIKNKKWYH